MTQATKDKIELDAEICIMSIGHSLQENEFDISKWAYIEGATPYAERASELNGKNLQLQNFNQELRAARELMKLEAEKKNKSSTAMFELNMILMRELNEKDAYVNLIKEMDKYLDNRDAASINTISSTSIFHQRMKELLESVNNQ